MHTMENWSTVAYMTPRCTNWTEKNTGTSAPCRMYSPAPSGGTRQLVRYRRQLLFAPGCTGLAGNFSLFTDTSRGWHLTVGAVFGDQRVDACGVVGFTPGDRRVEYTSHSQLGGCTHGVFFMAVKQISGAIAKRVDPTGLLVGEGPFTFKAAVGFNVIFRVECQRRTGLNRST